MDTKPWYLSKTIWLNIIGVAVAIAAGFGVDLGIDDGTKAEIAAGGLAVANVILRLVTKQPVTVLPQAP